MATTYNFLTLPLSSEYPFFKFTIPLSGVDFTLHFRYNSRMDRWMMDIADQADNMLLAAIPLLVSRNLLERFDNSAFPAGVFFVTDDTGNESDPTRYSWGQTHSLYYADPVVA